MKSRHVEMLALFMASFILTAGCRTSGLPTPAPIQYSLPKTVLVVELQVERTNFIPGRYCDFLDLFLPEVELVGPCQTKDNSDPGQDRVAAKNRTAVQGYSVALRGVPDTSRTHDVAFDGSWNIDRTDSLSLTEGGTLTGAEMQRINRTGEIVLGVLSNLAKIAGRFVFGGGSAVPSSTAADAPWIRLPALKENFDLMSTARQGAYTALWATTEGKARLTLASRSYEALGDDLDVLSVVLGGTGAQGAQTLVAELRKQIDARLADDFVGSKAKDTWSPTYELAPDVPSTGQTQRNYKLFDIAGCGISVESTQPVKNVLSVLRCGDLHGATASGVELTVATTSGVAPSREATPDKADDPTAVLYVIRPEPVLLNLAGICRSDVTLLAHGGTAAPTVFKESSSACNLVPQPTLLAQWGVQSPLSAAGKDWTYTLALYEATGGVKTIKLSSKAALDKGTVDSAFGIANTLLDAKDAAAAEAKKGAAAAAAAADELTQLTRARQILDEKAKIKKLCDELGLTNCGS